MRIVEKFLQLLRANAVVGGFEISDTMLRFVYFDGELWQLVSQRLPAGLMEAGIIKDRSGLREALIAFRREVATRIKKFSRTSDRHKLSAVLSLSSLNMYSQVFILPEAQGETFQEAIRLNLQMLSPQELHTVYASWQIINKTAGGRIEVLAAFAERKPIDETTELLHDAGFSVAAIEFRALSLSRLARERGVGFDPKKSTIIVSLDDSGLDFLVLRHGELYFHYFTAWHDLETANREISKADFENVVIRNLNQVLNFSRQHFQDSVKEVFLAASGVSRGIEEVIKKSFPLHVKELTLETDKPLSSDWFIVLGSGLRALLPRREDKEITLISERAEGEFRKAHLLRFLDFWRILVPGALALLLVVMLLGDFFLRRSRISLETQPLAGIQSDELEEFRTLEKQAAEFNRDLGLIIATKKSLRPQIPLLDKIKVLADTHQIELRQLAFESLSAPLALAGKGESLQKVLDFKNALSLERQFRDIDLSLQDVAADFSFSLHFFVISL